MPLPEPQAPLAEDTLFLACTRPAMIAGVTLEAMGVNVMVSATAFLAGHSLAYLLIAPALHLVLAGVCKTDPHAFRLLYLYVDTKGRARTAGLWGGSSPTPLPLLRRFRPAEAARG